MRQSLTRKIQTNLANMSSSQRKIAEYLSHHYEKAVFLTARELGNSLGVSESTVIRFAVLLGYSGYPELQKALQQMVQNRITTVERLQRMPIEADGNIINKVLASDINSIRLTMESANPDFGRAVNAITRADNIYIVSGRSAAALGYFLFFYLQMLLKNCRNINGAGTFIEELRPAGPGDLVIGISYPRYTRQTMEGLKLAKANGAKVLAITDSVTSPLVQYSDYTLIARSVQTSFIDSFVAPLSLLNALIIAVGNKNNTKTAKALGELEAVWQTFHIYHTEN
ncbi:sugar isomerase (sis) [Lucifera butyrica]|uniref:Sugar isomerase (Sis) n=1 Tax=Lucifera butyrica TaxID=1351585 RepID=A0A498R1T8_9FIRM|nr:MurR/RpiR family transcriptional regulator [Lucifera butyrica]VBB05341.1 sugar isomerase (sis) [Lucifera butyrica]